jgi:two-component system phosphate regulon sensor histidine kinase PhoR
VVRNADLSRFISRALTCQEPIEADVELLGDRQRVMQAHGSALHDSAGRAIGAVIVLNDVTDFRRLEHIRRDFVANVSHELKTPVAVLKSTLQSLLQRPRSSEEYRAGLQASLQDLDRLEQLLQWMLRLARAERAQRPVGAGVRVRANHHVAGADDTLLWQERVFHAHPAHLEVIGKPVLLRKLPEELRLLGRDRNFLVQTLVLPVVIVGAQVLFNAPGSTFRPTSTRLSSLHGVFRPRTFQLR